MIAPLVGGARRRSFPGVGGTATGEIETVG